jgi:hypothetical protein
MPSSARLPRLTWYEAVNVAIGAALAGDRDTAFAVLEANNGKLEHIRGALVAAVDAILGGAAAAPEVTTPHRDSPFNAASVTPFTIVQGGRSRDDFEN